MLDNVELKDSCAKAYETGRIHSNLIRLKKESFKNVGDKWKKFRISLLNKKLDRVKDELNNEIAQINLAGEKTEEIENRILDKTAVIARLEEKIKILSKENVPSNFVKTRAIKLKDDMIANVTLNSASAYTPKNEETKVVEDNLNDYGFTDFANTDFAMAAAVDTNEEDKLIGEEQIKSVIDDSFSAINAANQEVSENVENNETSVESEDLSGLFKENNMVDSPVEPVGTSIETEPVDQEEVVETPIDVVDTVDREQIEKEVETTQENETEDFKVSHNEVVPAKIEQYEEKISAADVYRPMSDEELSTARNNIEYEKYEDKYRTDELVNDSNVRDDITVVPDREEVVTEKVENNDDNLHFDYSEATVKDIENAVQFTTSSADLGAMMARVAELKRKQAESKERMDEAKRIREEEARRAEESKIALAEKEKEKEAYISKLNDYMEALENDIRFNDDETAATNEETENIRQTIENQEMQKVGFEKEISEINSVISPEAINVRVTRR